MNLNDPAAAGVAVERLLRGYPDSYFGDRGSLLEAQVLLNRKPNYTRWHAKSLPTFWPGHPSRRSCRRCNTPSPNLDHESNWPAAINIYSQWETNHPGHPRLPEVEFYLGLDYDQVGRTNEALTIFTNFVNRFPTNLLAPWAQNKVAEFYFNQDDFVPAEKSYLVLYQKFQKFPGAGDLVYQAQLGAGRAALARQDPDAARSYFTNLVNDPNTPPPLAARGYLALAEAAYQQFETHPTNKTYFDDVINAMTKPVLTNGAPTNAIAVEALGRLGDYYAYSADLKLDPDGYGKAARMCSNILSFPPASVSVAVRCQAEVGLGVIAAKENNPQSALNHFCNVVYYYDPANFDVYWVARAGEYAARICEDQLQWTQAINIYQRVTNAVPALVPVLQKKMAAAAAHLPASGN